VTVFGILLAALLLLLLAVFIITLCLYRIGLCRRPFPHSRMQADVWASSPTPRRHADGSPYDPYGWGERIRAADLTLYELAQTAPRYTVRSEDGLTLAARYFAPENGSPRGIVLMVHGYRSDPMNDFSCAVQDMRRMGMGCFLIEHRAHLTSEGDTITFGIRERYDIRTWARFLDTHFPGVPVIFDGISMGGTTVMLAAALDLPKNVCGIIADCGYTSMKEIFEQVIRVGFHLPPWPFIPLASLYCRLKNGFGFADITAQEALAKAKVPVILAHGTADTFVPFSMGEKIYEAVKGKIDVTFIAAEGADHGLSYLREYDTYHGAIADFFTKCIALHGGK